MDQVCSDTSNGIQRRVRRRDLTLWQEARRFLRRYLRNQRSGLGRGVGNDAFSCRSWSLGFLRLHIRFLRRPRLEVAEVVRGWGWCFGVKSLIERHGRWGAWTS